MKARHKDTGEIIQLAEEGVISSDGRHFCWYQVELLPEPIDEFQPSLPSNLDEAAEKYANNNYLAPDFMLENLMGEYDSEIDEYKFCTAEAFKAGAEWMAGRGVSFKVNVEEVPQGHWYAGLHLGGCAEEEENALKSINAKDGEEVIVQIRKKQ